MFNEEFYFETRPNELDKQNLILTVWDKDLGKSNDFLGSLVIGHASKGKRLKQWKDCIRLPDCFHDQWHYLSNDQHPYWFRTNRNRLIGKQSKIKLKFPFIRCVLVKFYNLFTYLVLTIFRNIIIIWFWSIFYSI